MAHRLILNVHTYIHTFILSYIHDHSCIYIYTYVYIHVLKYTCIYIYTIYIYIVILAQTYLQKNATVKFLRGGSCKTMVFYSSSRVPPKKIHCQCWRSPFLFPTAAVNKSNGEIFEGASCKTMVFYSSSRVPTKKNQLLILFGPF